MTMCNCNRRGDCTLAAIVLGVIAGIVAAFLQITGMVLILPVFLAAAVAVAVVYLGILLTAAVFGATGPRCERACAALNTILVGILGTILFAAILLGVGVAVSVVGAILFGLLVLFFTLMVAGTACYIRCGAGCDE